MTKLLVTIVGADRPGIVHLVSAALFARGCVISELAQTTLHGQFAGLFSVEAPDGLLPLALTDALSEGLKGSGLSSWVTPGEDGPGLQTVETEPYVISITGPDSPGLIPDLTEGIAALGANILNLRSLSLTGGDGPAPVVLVLEVTLPATVARQKLSETLNRCAESLGLEISLQHRDIFEAIHRI
ncbi:MAG: hypothetical protein LBF40_00025 [Deltaproteobacteria bacterium]|jgi:glycine cleavage system transcriptional repressor|nr:hypothetical protein [Deltaproteobacteria bacterium]